MKHGKSERLMVGVKIEVENDLEEEHGPLRKRPKSLGKEAFIRPTLQYNPLNEPSPLGLRLRKSPSLLDLIQMKLSQSSTKRLGELSQTKKDPKASAASGDKLKASNFPASTLKIGTWEYKSRHEGDLVAKYYYAKHKLVWEVLDGGLKNKIEIQWSDIMALKANYPDDNPGTFNVVLAQPPLFFRETSPQPRKHTLWQATKDFTGGQASMNRQHFLECPPGLLGKHYEKLIQCDPRLYFLSQQGEMTLESPYFEKQISATNDQDNHADEFDLNRKGSPSIFSFNDAPSPSGGQSSSSNNDALATYEDSYPHETPSPTSVRAGKNTSIFECTKAGKIEQFKNISNWDQIKAPGLKSSMSMSDFVSHLENRVSERGESSNPTLSNDEWESLQILDDINRCLFTDVQHIPNSDEKSLMSRVNSLCCLLQKEDSKTENGFNNVGLFIKTEENNIVDDESNIVGISRKDSVGDLLLNLPRIASLPQFLFNITEDFENRAR